jgi:excisionase family DNA binding protein
VTRWIAHNFRAVLLGVSIDPVNADPARAASPSPGASERQPGRPPVQNPNGVRGAGGTSDLTPASAANELGCSRTLVYRLIERGELPGTYVLPGSNRKRIPRSDLDALRQRHLVRPRPDLPIHEPQRVAARRERSRGFAGELDAIERGEAA